MPVQYQTLTTTRLTLRPWHDNDIAAFAAINQDPAVMHWIGDALTLAQTESWVGRMVVSVGYCTGMSCSHQIHIRRGGA